MAKKKVAKKKEVVETVVAEPEVTTTQNPTPSDLAIEANNTGAPKNFMIRCHKCCWGRVSSGLSADLTDLHEIKSNCPTCGKARQFKCPRCGQPAKMKRFKGNT